MSETCRYYDEDVPDSVCGEPATHRSCCWMGGDSSAPNVCAAHKCRCARATPSPPAAVGRRHAWIDTHSGEQCVECGAYYDVDPREDCPGDPRDARIETLEAELRDLRASLPVHPSHMPNVIELREARETIESWRANAHESDVLGMGWQTRAKAAEAELREAKAIADESNARDAARLAEMRAAEAEARGYAADGKRQADRADAAEAREAGLRAALDKIDKIRDSIVGMQGFNFSEHAYPLVAALKEAGYEGAGYEIARTNLGTLIEQIKAAEAEAADAATQREQLAEVNRAQIADLEHANEMGVDAYDMLEMERDTLRAELAEARASFAGYNASAHVLALKENDTLRAQLSEAMALIDLKANLTADVVAAQDLAEDAERERDVLRARLAARDALLGMDTKWPVHDLLRVLADAADHLLHDHDCDTHGWEVYGGARDAARDLVRRAGGKA
jgi:hypothetical protein